MVVVSPSTSASNSSAKLISGRLSGGNSTSTTGPMMATMRPSFSPVLPAWAVTLTRTPWIVYSCVGPLGLLRLALGQPFGAADDLHDLGGDGVLPGPVGDPLEVGDQVVGVVGCRLHG